MTSTEIVDLIRHTINKLHPTETFQDAQLWNTFTLARSRVYKNQFNRKNKIANQAYHKVCLELIEAPQSECGCQPHCKAKRTKNQLPGYIHSDSRSTLTTLTQNNKEIAQVDEQYQEEYSNYHPAYKNKPNVWESNGYLYFRNYHKNYVQVQAIWTNPLDLLFIQYCSDDNCLQDSKELIQIEESLLLDMINITVQTLTPALQIPTDNTIDNNERV